MMAAGKDTAQRSWGAGKRLRKYGSFFRIRLVTGLQYRTAAWAGLCTQFFWGLMEIMIFKAFYETGTTGGYPMELGQVTDYLWLQQAFLTMFFVWNSGNDILELIRSGNIAYELVRPMDLYNQWLVKNLAERAAKVLLRFWPVLLVAFLLPEPFNLAMPINGVAFACFLFTMVMGCLLVVAYLMLVIIATIYVLNPMGIRLIAISMTEFLTGALIPLPFLPQGLQRFLELSPFGSMQNLPLRIYCGDIAGAEMWQAMALQLFWVVVLIGIGRLWMKRALKRVVAQGG